jgi:hypothetical protein
MIFDAVMAKVTHTCCCTCANARPLNAPLPPPSPLFLSPLGHGTVPARRHRSSVRGRLPHRRSPRLLQPQPQGPWPLRRVHEEVHARFLFRPPPRSPRFFLFDFFSVFGLNQYPTGTASPCLFSAAAATPSAMWRAVGAMKQPAAATSSCLTRCMPASQPPALLHAVTRDRACSCRSTTTMTTTAPTFSCTLHRATWKI